MKNYILGTMLVFLMFTSCATQTALLSKATALEDGQGYLYGNFEGTHIDTNMFGFKFSTIGIVVEDVDTEKTYGFILKHHENRLQIIEVPPGNYRLKEIEYLYVNELGAYAVSSTEAFDIDWYSTDFTVQANTAIYLGDFFGTASSSNVGNYISRSWNLTKISDSFELTTEQLKNDYPSFIENSITFVSNIDIPEREIAPNNVADLIDILNSSPNKNAQGVPILTPEQLAEVQAMFEAANSDL